MQGQPEDEAAAEKAGRQPGQGHAEDGVLARFGVSGAEVGGELSEKNSGQSIAEIEGHTAETQHGGAHLGFGPKIEVV